MNYFARALFLLFVNVEFGFSVECIDTDCNGNCDSAWSENHTQRYVDCLLADYGEIQQSETIFIGDSNVDNWRGQIEGIASGDVVNPSYNLGNSGETCHGYAGYAQTVLDQTHPSTVVVHCGENDFNEWDTPEEVYANLIMLWNILRNHASVKHVIYIGTMDEPALSNSESRNHRALDEIIRTGLGAEDNSLVLNGQGDSTYFTFVDIYNKLESVGNGDWLYGSDDLHLAPFGYKVWNDALRDAMDSFFTLSVAKYDSSPCAGTPSSSVAARGHFGSCINRDDGINFKYECTGEKDIVIANQYANDDFGCENAGVTTSISNGVCHDDNLETISWQSISTCDALTSCSSTLSCEKCTCAQASDDIYTYELDTDLANCAAVAEIMGASYFVHRSSKSKCRIPLFAETNCVGGRVNTNNDWNIYALTCSAPQNVTPEPTDPETSDQYDPPLPGEMNSIKKLLERGADATRFGKIGKRAGNILRQKKEDDRLHPDVKKAMRKIKRFSKQDFSQSKWNKMQNTYNDVAHHG